MTDAERYRALLEKWLDLAERTMTEQPLQFDANRQMDFYQGIQETREALADDFTGAAI